MPEGAATGALPGSVLGLVGIGASAVPGSACPPDSVPVGGARWIYRSVSGPRTPEDHAKRFQVRIRNGGLSLSVHCEYFRGNVSGKNSLKATGAPNSSSTEKSARS